MRTFYTSHEVLKHELAIRNRGTRSMTIYISNGNYKSESKTIEPEGLRVFEFNLYNFSINATYINYVFDKNAFLYDLHGDIITDWLNDKTTLMAKIGCTENRSDENFVICLKKYTDSLQNIGSNNYSIEFILKLMIEKERTDNSIETKEVYDIALKYALRKFAIGRTNEILKIEPLLNLYLSNYHYSEPISSQISSAKTPGYAVEFGSFIPKYGFKDGNSAYKTAKFSEQQYFQIGVYKNFRLKWKRKPINFIQLGIMRGKLLYNTSTNALFTNINKGISYDHLYFKTGNHTEGRSLYKTNIGFTWESGLLCNIRRHYNLDCDSLGLHHVSNTNFSKVETLKLLIGFGASLVFRNFAFKLAYLGSFNEMWFYKEDGRTPMKFFNSVNMTFSIPIKQSNIYTYRYQ